MDLQEKPRDEAREETATSVAAGETHERFEVARRDSPSRYRECFLQPLPHKGAHVNAPAQRVTAWAVFGCACNAHVRTDSRATMRFDASDKRGVAPRPCVPCFAARHRARRKSNQARAREDAGALLAPLRLQTVAGALVPRATPRQFSGSAYVAGAPRLPARPSHKKQSLKNAGIRPDKFANIRAKTW